MTADPVVYEYDSGALWLAIQDRLDKESSAEGCWLWTGAVNKGYATLKVNRRRLYVHRLAVLARGDAIPDGLCVDHMCHNRSTACARGPACQHRRCVNPDHLDVVTPMVNSSRAPNPSVGREPIKPLEFGYQCSRGHWIASLEDLYIPPRTGWQECRACRASARHRKSSPRPSATVIAFPADDRAAGLERTG
jgi:hypothetical protein